MKIGTAYNKWTTTSAPFKEKRGQKEEWFVNTICQCGAFSKVKKASLLNGKSSGCKSCGKRFSRTEEQLKETAIKAVILDYKDSASIRGLSFSLSDEEVKTFIFHNCHYCGSEPLNTKKNSRVEVKYNGIDRVDNTKGYTIKNSVPCCKKCNSAKGKLSIDEFNNWIINLYNSLNKRIK